MRFQMDHLQALVAVLDEGTFEAAVRLLGVTASAVSQRIKAREQIAGQVLRQRVSPVTGPGTHDRPAARGNGDGGGDVYPEAGAGMSIREARHHALPRRMQSRFS